MDKIAIISDIHGNLEALKTVLEDIKKRNITRIFCLGDIIAKGTHQQECVDLIRENCEIVIRGNCDRVYEENAEELGNNETEIKRNNWKRSKLNKESINYLFNLPFCYEFYMSGRLIRLVHAHPEKIDKFAGNIDKIERLYELLLPSENTISNEIADILIYGHTHVQNMQKMYNRTIINTGSVGNPIEVFRNDEKNADDRNTTVANYLILSGNYNSKNINEEISYEFINLPYDIEKELSDNDDNIELESYTEEIRKGRYRDMSKVYKGFEIRGIDKEKI